MDSVTLNKILNEPYFDEAFIRTVSYSVCKDPNMESKIWQIINMYRNYIKEKVEEIENEK